MVDWNTGLGNARYHVLNMLINHFGYKEEMNKDMYKVEVDNGSDKVFSKSYIVEGSKKTLIVNKVLDSVTL